MAFWGVEVKPGKPFAHKYDGMKGRLHISMATLGFGTATSKSILQCNVGNRRPVYLCSLYAGNTESLQLNLEFEEVDEVIFSVIGPRSIHLSGYYLGSGRNTNINEDSESYGEDIVDTETEKSVYSDEDEYEDSFIDDDGDPEVFPPSPVSNEEEASHDNRPSCKKSSRQRLRRKYQTIESDDDECFEEKKTVNDSMFDRIKEYYDEDDLPVSSLCNNKASGRILEQEMGDRVAGDASNENAEGGGSSIFETNLKADNVPENSQTHREAELADYLGEPCSVLDVGHGKKLKKKKKGKEKEANKHCSDQSIKLDNAMQAVPKVVKKDQDLLIGNCQDAEIPGDKEIETKERISSSEVRHGQDEKPKKKRKERTKEGIYLASNVDNLCQRNEHSQQQLINEGVENVAHAFSDGNQSEDRKVKKRMKKSDYLENVEVVNSEMPQESVGQSTRFLKQDGRGVDNVVHDFNDRNQSDHRKVKKSSKKSRSQGNVELVNYEEPELSLRQNSGTVMENGKEKVDEKPSQVRTLTNGLVIEELEMGTKDGKIAASGKKISIFYIGKLKENGEVFESNAGQTPFKFRLGKRQVIEGWDVGLEGMQVGEKRRLVIPPSMASLSEEHCSKIPPNSWLVYDIELVKVH